jgi:hypothetical protein
MYPMEQQPKFVRWALLAGIVIILNVFFSVVVALAYPQPDYEAFCPHSSISPTDAKTCDAEGGQWTQYAPVPEQVSGPKVSGYCDMYAKCQKPYEAAREQHSLYAFVIMVALGIVALLVGFIPLGSSILSSGLSYGGVLALIIGSAQYWGDAGNWIRLAISTVGLLALLFIAYRKFRD